MFTQLLQNQQKAKHSERSSRRIRHYEGPHSQSEEVYSIHHNVEDYQPLPRQHRNKNPTFPNELKVDLLPIHGREDVEEYLEWEMKVENIFKFHHVDEIRTLSMATLAFQKYAMSW